MPRSRLGPLAVESKLGDYPSQSYVWRALHLQLKRELAVKIFQTPFGATPEARQQFADEWTRLQKITHPAIAKCYGGGFEETDAYLAYELIEGETLAAALERRNRIPWEMVLDIADPIADALELLHNQGIVHGKIEPSKIMISGLSPILLDVRVDRFGSAFRTSRPPNESELALMAPELIASGNLPTVASDLYSLGATLYLALTGRPPIPGDSIAQITANAASHVVDPPSALINDSPVWLDKVILQLLEKDPDARPHGATAVKLALAEARRRSLARTSVVEATSAGFGPLNVNDQSERDAVRRLLGRDPVSYQDDVTTNHTSWHEKGWVLILGLFLAIGFGFWMFRPLSESQMRARAEPMIAEGSRMSLSQARSRYLEPMLAKYPDGVHASWAQEQIERIEMAQAESALKTKVNRNLPLKNEAERLYAEANEYERFGDNATALDKYRSLTTLLGDDPEYRPFVNLARRQIASIQKTGLPGNSSEAEKLVRAKLAEADELIKEGKVIAGRQILYSVVELYQSNAEVAPLVLEAQNRLSDEKTLEKQSP
jgi:eukaryotic-like serine/threonine-protein kinase